MLYFQRAFAAAAFFVLLFSAFVLPETVSARTKRCPVEIPDSLLTLYLKSDLIVVASLKSEKVLKMTQEYDYGSYYNVEKILDIDETFKGQKLDAAAYEISEYKPKNSDASEATADGENEYSLKSGEKALFFLVKDAEGGNYKLAHYSAAIKQLNGADLHLYEKRIKELKSILAKNKDQHARLAEWLVRLIEEPATRDEGVRDLLASFTHSDYETEYVEEVTDVKENADEQPQPSAEAKIEETADRKPVAIDKDFRTANAPEIAAALTDSQKARVSNVLFTVLNNDLTKLNSAEDEEYASPDYELIKLVACWDKQNFAMNLFANLQSADRGNHRRTTYLMNAIAYFLDDDNSLFTIAGEYEYAVSQDENAKTDYTENHVVIAEAENTGEVSDAETSGEARKTEEVSPESSAPTEAETAAVEEGEKITYKRYGEKLFDGFVEQYGKIISRSVAAK